MAVFQISKNGARWEFDNGLKDLAKALVDDFPDELGHLDLNRIVFGRVQGAGEKFGGKTYSIAPPTSMLPMYVIEMLIQRGIKIDEQAIEGLGAINFIIFIGVDYLSQFAHDDNLIKQQEKILLFHELLHIKPTMDGLRGHDIKDFKSIVGKFGAYWDEGIVD